MATASVALDAATEILMPGSEDEAIAAFGAGPMSSWSVEGRSSFRR